MPLNCYGILHTWNKTTTSLFGESIDVFMVFFFFFFFYLSRELKGVPGAFLTALAGIKLDGGRVQYIFLRLTHCYQPH